MVKKYLHPVSHIPLAIGIGLIIFIVSLWQFSAEQRFTLFFINKAIASTAVILICLSYFMGPLVKLIPPLRRQIMIRKYFGLFGFITVLIHIGTTLLQFTNRIPLKWYTDHLWGFFAALAGTVIFLFLFLNSNDHSYLTLGKNNWKIIQRLGYLALLLTLVHIYFAAIPRWLMFF